MKGTAIVNQGTMIANQAGSWAKCLIEPLTFMNQGVIRPNGETLIIYGMTGNLNSLAER